MRFQFLFRVPRTFRIYTITIIIAIKIFIMITQRIIYKIIIRGSLKNRKQTAKQAVVPKIRNSFQKLLSE